MSENVKNDLSIKERKLSRIFLWVIKIGVYLALITPLITSNKVFFPFMATKGLYFMALAEIVIFSWLGLLIISRKYRPQLNALSIALLIMLAVFILSAMLGVNPSYSFWSKFERMSGINMLLHLTGFFLAVSSVFKKQKDWQKLFVFSVSVAIITAFMSLMGYGGSSKGGAMIGNTSFMGAYLLFNVFFSVYIFFKQKNIYLKIGSVLAVILMILAIYDATARAAFLSVIGGLSLLALLYLSFVPKKRIVRLLGRTLLIIFFVLSLVSGLLLFKQNSFIRNYFIEKATKARLVAWEVGWNGFKQRPILGYGPENFEFAFHKNFNPCLFLSECGSEVWFDRAHNIVFDTLATTGILGFLAYIFIFISAFFVLWKQYFKDKIDFWAVAIPTVILIAYSVQNLTVFDVVSSYLMLFLLLSFISVITTNTKHKKEEIVERKQKRWLLWVLLVVFIPCIYFFVVKPLKQATYVIEAMVPSDFNTHMELYNKAFYTSSMGKFQIKDFLAEKTFNDITKSVEGLLPDEQIDMKLVGQELDLLIKALNENLEESPLDFKSMLTLFKIYNLYASLDKSKMPLVEEYGQKVVKIFPNNQQSYWQYAQTKLYQKDVSNAFELAQKAIDLEPKLFRSYSIAFSVLSFSPDQEKQKELIEQVILVDPTWLLELIK